MEFHFFSKGKVAKLSDNILFIKYNQLELIDKEDIIEVTTLREKLIGNIPYHSVTDFTDGLINMSKEAKKYVAKTSLSNNMRLSDSFIVKSMARKIELDIYLKIMKPKVKSKTFSDLESALKWIDQLKKEAIETP